MLVQSGGVATFALLVTQHVPCVHSWPDPTQDDRVVYGSQL